MIITIGGIKGGSGKTTIATNLAIHLASIGNDVLLVDADDQATATDFANARQEYLNDNPGRPTCTHIQLSSRAVRDQVTRLENKYSDIVIDTGGRDTSSQRAALTVSDLFLVPFAPQSFDIWTLGQVEEIFEEIQTINTKIQAYTFLNRAFPVGKDNKDAAEILKDAAVMTFVEPFLVARKVYSNAASSGLSILEMRPQDNKATNELLGLFSRIGVTKENVHGRSA